MVILKEDVCYIEREDLEFLGSLPTDILNTINMSEYYSTIFDLIRVTDNDAIRFFKNNKQLLNYNNVKHLSKKSLEGNIIKIKTQLDKLSQKWLESSASLRKKLDKDMDYQKKLKNLKYMLSSLEKYQSSKASYDSEISNLSSVIKRIELNIYHN